jgi:AraC-like DNA-binding protein
MDGWPGLLQWGRKARPIGYRNHYDRYPQAYAICVTGGRLRLERPGLPAQVLRAGDGVVLAPEAAFTLSTPDSAYAGHFVEWQPEPGVLPPRAVALVAQRTLRAVIDAIEGEYAGGADGEALALLYALLARRIRLCLARQGLARPGDDGGDSPAAMLRARLRAHLQTDASIADIIGDASRQRQARRVLEAAGLPPPKRLLLEMKLDEGRRLLRATPIPVTAIAFELGFPSSQHFATCYRRRFGCPPSGERRG